MATVVRVQPKPATFEDAALMALDEALAEAGFARFTEQPIACDDLERDVLDKLWNDDMTLQEAARAAVRRYEKRLVEEARLRCNG